jgi:hypothetical protein
VRAAAYHVRTFKGILSGRKRLALVCSNFTGRRKVEVQLLPFILLAGLYHVAPPLPSHTRGNRDTTASAGIFEQSMGARNQVKTKIQKNAKYKG